MRTVSRMLERIPLAIRLGALVTIPLLVIALESYSRLNEVGVDDAAAESFSEQVDSVVAIEAAIRAFQTERDLTVQLYTLTANDPARDQLELSIQAARVESGAALVATGLSDELPSSETSYEQELESARPVPSDDVPKPPGSGVGGEGSGVRRFTSGGRSVVPWEPRTLTELYELASQQEPTAARVADIYTDFIGSLQSELLAEAGIDAGTVPASYLVSYQNVLLGAEQFAQLRSRGLILLADGDPSSGELRALGQTNEQERFFLKQAEGIARPEQRRVLHDLLGAPAVASVDEVKRAILQAGGPDDDLTRGVWLVRTEVRLSALNELTDAFQGALQEQVDTSVSAAQRAYTLILIRSVLVVLAVAVGAWLVSRSISNPLRRLSVAARNASVGRLTPVDAPPSKDAIGEIGRAYRDLTSYMDEVSVAADEISRGDLSRQIHPRSSEDRLGTALQLMTRQLSSMVSQSRRRSRELAETVDELQETVARDSLTGLVSRARFEQLLGEWVKTARPTGRTFGVLFIDLDGFKPVNDTLGHDAGDELLREVARRLSSAVRQHDVVARLGGDEFTVLLNDPRDLDALRQTARRVVEMVRIPYVLDGREVRIGASVGLARYPDHGASAEELLRASDRAMYGAKHAGGGGLRIAEPDEAA